MNTPSPSRSPLDALSLVLGSVDAIRNLRALYLLLATFASAGILVSMAEASLARGSGVWGPLQAGAALFVAFYGGNAAGVLVMDQSRGLPVRDVGDALRTALFTAHRLLLALLLIGIGYALLGGALLGLMWLSRVAVSGPVLGPVLFGLAVPLGVVGIGFRGNWAAEGKVLFLVPSINLLSQTVREWVANAGLPIRPLAVCSDPKATRKAGRLRRIVAHDSPDWNASSDSRSNRPRSSRTGIPHSVS